MDHTETTALISTLDILKVAASKDIYPMYAQYVRSKEGVLSTCNDDVYASLYFDLPFEGCVNLFVLQNVLKSINKTEVDIDMFVEDDKLVISSGAYKTKLNIIDYNALSFPDIEIEDNLIPGENAISLSHDKLYERIRFASYFLGQNIYNYVVLDKDGICATDTSRIYLWNYNIDINREVMMDKKIITFANNTSTIGVGEYNNIIVEREDGFAIFTIDIGRYPVERIRNYTGEKVRQADHKIINAAILADCSSKMIPILLGETESFVKFYNENKEFTVSATSSINGFTELTYDSLSNVMTETVVDINRFKNIPFDYDIYIPKKESDFISLKNDDDSIILIMGVD